MSVYVDEPFVMRAQEPEAARVGAKHGHRWCHLMADTLEELHEFAARVGMRREWFQGDHYDLVPSRRAHAVKLGAIEVTGRELVAVRRRLRALRCDCDEMGPCLPHAAEGLWKFP